MAALQSTALTIGRAHSVVLLGQAMDLSVPIQFDALENASSLCFGADVYYGDVRVDASQVNVSTKMDEQTRLATVHIVSRAKIDEPIVTVYLRAACDLKLTRRFVLLTDVASDVDQVPAATNAAPPTLPAPGVGAASAAQVPVAVVSAPAVLAPATRAESKRKAASVVPAPPTAKAPRSTAAPVRAPAKGAPRLQLTPLNLSADWEPVLKSSDQLASMPADDARVRAQAAAWWRALNMSPQDFLRLEDNQRAMDKELRTLRSASQSSHQEIGELKVRMDALQSERYANPLVYALSALLLACGAALFVGWQRLKGTVASTPHWWRGGAGEGADAQHDANRYAGEDSVWHAGQLPQQVAEAAVPSRPHATVADTTVDLDLDLEASKGASKPPAEPAPAAPSGFENSRFGQQDFMHSTHSSLRALNSQEMLDVRQQAEFFMTLGQHQEAIRVLEESTHQSGEANPLVFLDLLHIFHTLSRRQEFDACRNDFQAHFTGHVPPYTQFNDYGQSLDAYPAVCDRIANLWPDEQVVGLIEDYLLCDADGKRAQEFDLEAFQDLLMLHGVARRVCGSTDSNLQPFSTARVIPLPPTVTIAAPLEANAMAEMIGSDMDMPAIDAHSLAELDLDLSEPEGNLIDFDGIGFPPDSRSTP